MKKRHIVMLAALAVTAWPALFGDKTPNGGIATPVERSGRSKGTAVQSAGARADDVTNGNSASESSSDKRKKAKREVTILALRDRTELIGGASSGNSGNLFTSQSWAPPPPPPAKAGPTLPPTAPAIPFTFLGKKHEDAAWEVYLAHGETTLIAREKSTIEGTYRVDSIKPPLLTLTYLPMSQQQTLPIGDAE